MPTKRHLPFILSGTSLELLLCSREGVSLDETVPTDDD